MWVLRMLVLGQLALRAHAAELTPDQDARYREFTHHLRCLVCQNQTIADSNAPLANDLREQVRAQILAGRSDDQITQYVTDRYGDFVLYKPPFKASTALLWLAPVLLLIVGGFTALGFLRRTRTPRVAAKPDDAALRRLLDEKR